jgi:isopentenyl diphosphate isomerase/L-lactate dehydrogenase-like FMN-dependent dehydrogenase
VGDGGRASRVEKVLEILRGGIDETVVSLGRSSIRDLVADDLVVPPGLHPWGWLLARRERLAR